MSDSGPIRRPRRQRHTGRRRHRNTLAAADPSSSPSSPAAPAASLPSPSPPSPAAAMADLPLCPICLQPIVGEGTERETQCHHVFHDSCLNFWEQHVLNTFNDGVQQIPTCPVCRGNLHVENATFYSFYAGFGHDFKVQHEEIVDEVIIPSLLQQHSLNMEMLPNPPYDITYPYNNMVSGLMMDWYRTVENLLLSQFQVAMHGLVFDYVSPSILARYYAMAYWNYWYLTYLAVNDPHYPNISNPPAPGILKATINKQKTEGALSDWQDHLFHLLGGDYAEQYWTFLYLCS